MDAFSTLAASALVLIMTHIDDSLYVNYPSSPTILLSELDSKGSDSSVPVDAEKEPMFGGYWCVIA
jgi:hypothetical protein